MESSTLKLPLGLIASNAIGASLWPSGLYPVMNQKRQLSY